MAKQYGKWKVIRALSEGGQAHTYLVSEDGAEDKDVFVLKRLKTLSASIVSKKKSVLVPTSHIRIFSGSSIMTMSVRSHILLVSTSGVDP